MWPSVRRPEGRLDSSGASGVVSQLCRDHPRFPEQTVRRLVDRTVAELSWTADGRRREIDWAEVRRLAAEQLDYADGLEEGAPRRP